MPPARRVPANLAAARLKRHPAPSAAAAPPLTDPPVTDPPVADPPAIIREPIRWHRKPSGRAPQIGLDGLEAEWDYEVGCWCDPGGSVHEVMHNKKRKLTAEAQRAPCVQIDSDLGRVACVPTQRRPLPSGTWDDTLQALLFEGRYAPCSSPLQVGCRVQTVQKHSVAVHGVRWYKGVVLDVEADGNSYTIEYDDGEISVLVTSDTTEIIVPELTDPTASRLEFVTEDSIAKLNAKMLAHGKKILNMSEAAAAREAAEKDELCSSSVTEAEKKMAAASSDSDDDVPVGEVVRCLMDKDCLLPTSFHGIALALAKDGTSYLGVRVAARDANGRALYCATQVGEQHGHPPPKRRHRPQGQGDRVPEQYQVLQAVLQLGVLAGVYTPAQVQLIECDFGRRRADTHATGKLNVAHDAKTGRRGKQVSDNVGVGKRAIAQLKTELNC